MVPLYPLLSGVSVYRGSSKEKARVPKTEIKFPSARARVNEITKAIKTMPDWDFGGA